MKADDGVFETEIFEEVRRIQCLTSRLVTDVMAGQYESVFKGRGMEFTQVRQYEIGDDIRTIDWNVTARMGVPHVKEYVEERELTVMILVDASRSLDVGSARRPTAQALEPGLGRTKREFATRLAAVLALTAVKNNDKVGLMIFTDDVELFVPPMKGKRHVLRVIRELLAFKPARRGTNIKNALEYLGRVNRRKCVVFIISDYIDEGFEQDLTIAARRHDVVPIRIVDRLEQELPPIAGILRLIDPETGEERLFDGRSKERLKAYADAAGEADQRRDETFRRRGVDLLSLNSGDDDYVHRIMNHFRERERRR